MNKVFDVVIVGSGPSGVHAAYPLIEAGLNVAIIDGGLVGSFHDISQKTNQSLKIKSNIKINQTFAKGGLSEVWPGICDYFTQKELTNIGLPPNEIRKEYKEISKLINLDTKPSLDIHGLSILKASSEAYRLPAVYPYRTSSVIEDFKKHKNFLYISNQQVLKAIDKKTSAEIQCLSIDSKIESSFNAKYLILAAGSINTTRILLRSFNLYNYKAPFLTKNYYAIVCLNIRSGVNRSLLKKESGQVAISNNDLFIQFYRCNPNSFSKVFPFIPFPKLFSTFIQFLSPFLIVADLRFPAIEGKEKYVRLKKQGGTDILEVSFCYNNIEVQKHRSTLRKIKRQLMKLGFLPLKTINDTTTSHYADGVPSQDSPGILTVDSNGKLHQSERIYIADSSTWRTLPAKPPTLTIMANARRVGKKVLRDFNKL